MQRVWASLFLLAFLPFLGSSPLDAQAPATPALKIDKKKLEDYIRYAEAFSSSVKIAVDEPVPTALSGYSRVVAHLSMGESKEDKVYYLTADGKHLITGPVWDLNDSPFLETAAEIPTDGPSFGPANAKITLVVFSDFECPYCREFARTIREEISKKYPTDVRVVFKDFPIASIHPWARAAAEGAHCLADGKVETFWSFHDWIFEHQGEITVANLREKMLGFAKDHNLAIPKIASCLDTHATAAEVDSSLKEGQLLQIRQTPTFFLNGRAVPGTVSAQALDTLIQMELNRPSSIPAATPKPAGGK